MAKPRLRRLAALAVVLLTVALSSVAAPAMAAPFVGAVRTFDSESTGSAPSGCSSVGVVSVESAALAGAVAGNRAAKLVDASSTSFPRLVCPHAASAQKSVTMRLLATQMDIGVIVALGASPSDTIGSWRFSLTRSGTNIAIAAYNGSSWIALGTAPNVSPTTRWFELRIDATSTNATIEVDRVRFPTTVRAAASATMESIIINSAGTAPVGLQLFIDDLGIASTVPAFTAVVAATAPVGDAIRFPGSAKLPDGTIVVAYNEMPGHSGSNSVIKVVRSADDGLTWSAPIVAIDPLYDPRGPNLTILSDGTLLMTYFYAKWDTFPYTIYGTYTIRSSDGGLSWSSPSLVGTQMTCACGPAGSGIYSTGWAAQKAPIVELASGDLLAPLYGTTSTDARERATVVRSSDGGVTWDSASEVTLGVGAIAYQEPYLTVLPTGEIVATIRTTSTPRRLYIARSFDDGYTWTAPVATDIPAESHSQTLLSDGSILFTYGNPERAGRPTEGIIIDDPSGSWDGRAIRATPIYDSGIWDQGNPTSIEIDPGEFLTIGYNVTNRTMSAIFTARGDYAG
ncbi:sialidase family protein [Microbacterium saperdae]